MRCESCNFVSKGFFCGLDPLALSGINENKVIHKIKKGKPICLEGTTSHGIFCIRSGKVKITKKTENGKESLLRIVTVGDLIGHYSLINNFTYKFSAIALEDTEACFIDKQMIVDALNTHSSLAMALIKKFSDEMHECDERFSSIVQRNVRERLAELLLNLSKSFGVQEDERIRLGVRLTRDEMGSMIGTVNETVTRFISEFKDEGLIEEEGKTIYIVNEDKLHEFANAGK